MASPSTYRPIFGDDDNMEVDTPSQNLMRLLAEKAKENQAAKEIGTKRTREKTTPNKSLHQTPQRRPQASHVNSIVPERRFRQKFWYGFTNMEKLAMEEGLEELFDGESIEDRVLRGVPRKEAEEMEGVAISFPRIPQIYYPGKREDGVLGQHLNLTQIPYDIPIDPNTCLALDFHVAIEFQLPNTPLFHNHVKELVRKRLELMQIPLGTNLIEPISIMCMSVKRGGEKGVWAGIAKLHLLHPEIDGVALLKGLRPFILQLDPKSTQGTLGKVCKTYHSIARNNNLSIKITSETLIDVSSHMLFKDILENSFRRGHEFEIVEVQKSTPNNHAYIVAPTPSQAKKIQTLQVATHHEILEGQVNKGPSLTLEQKQRKEALTLTFYNLPILMSIDDTSLEICKIIGTKNVVSIWFHKQDGIRHNGSANVECLNPFVYKKFVGKEEKIGVYHVEITPHRRSLDGIDKPSKDLLVKFGFEDTNTCLVNTIEAIQNQNQGEKNATKSEVFTIMKEAIEEGNKKLKLELHEEMKVLKEDIVKEAHNYVDDINEKLKKQMLDIQSTLTMALTGMQQITGLVNPNLMIKDLPNVD